MNQVWVSDITYVHLGRKFIYLEVILNAFTRCIRGWNLGRSLEKTLTMDVLMMSLARHPAPVFHRSDQDAQYVVAEYKNLLDDADDQISMSAIGQPAENAWVERFIRSMKEEHIDFTE